MVRRDADDGEPARADDELANRVLVIGNSGSGKSTLARRLAAQHGLAHLDLDTLAWLPAEPPQRVPLPVAEQELARFTRAHARWVIEGCYADLVELLAADATELLFLDLPVSVCQHHARQRPWEPHKYPTKAAQDANLAMLLDFIAGYPEREGVLGRRAHEELFERFAGTKRRLVAAAPIAGDA